MTKKIISVSGRIGSGKDTVGNYLVTHHGFKRLSFASSLKDGVAVIFGWDREMLEGATKSSREWREQQDVWWAKRLDIPHLTPRWVLQNWGTEVLRKNFHNDIWIASLEFKLLNTKDDVVITDARFPNEIEAIRRIGGITTCVQRGTLPHWHDIAIQANHGQSSAIRWLSENNVHASEYSHIGLQYDKMFDNNSSIDSLNTQIAALLRAL